MKTTGKPFGQYVKSALKVAVAAAVLGLALSPSSAFAFGGGRGAIVGGAIGLLVGVCSYFFRLMSQSGKTKLASSVDENAQYDSYLNQPNAE